MPLKKSTLMWKPSPEALSAPYFGRSFQKRVKGSDLSHTKKGGTVQKKDLVALGDISFECPYCQAMVEFKNLKWAPKRKSLKITKEGTHFRGVLEFFCPECLNCCLFINNRKGETICQFHQKPDGRWFVQYRNGKKLRREFFGRGPEAKDKAIGRNAELGLRDYQKNKPKDRSTFLIDLVNSYAEAQLGQNTETTLQGFGIRCVLISCRTLATCVQ